MIRNVIIGKYIEKTINSKTPPNYINSSGVCSAEIAENLFTVKANQQYLRSLFPQLYYISLYPLKE